MQTVRSVIPYPNRRPEVDPNWSALGAPIESDVPIVPKLKYKFNEMEFGDSFRIPTERARMRVASAATNYTARHPSVRFTVRKAPDYGWRCWRVA